MPQEPTPAGALTPLVERAIARIRPALELDGGDITLLGVDESTGVVRVELAGACAGCSNQSTTVAFGVERALKQMVPGVTGVETV